MPSTAPATARAAPASSSPSSALPRSVRQCSLVLASEAKSLPSMTPSHDRTSPTARAWGLNGSDAVVQRNPTWAVHTPFCGSVSSGTTVRNPSGSSPMRKVRAEVAPPEPLPGLEPVSEPRSARIIHWREPDPLDPPWSSSTRRTFGAASSGTTTASSVGDTLDTAMTGTRSAHDVSPQRPSRTTGGTIMRISPEPSSTAAATPIRRLELTP